MTAKTVTEQLAATIKDHASTHPDPQHYRGYDWWHLTEEEEYVFSLELEDMALLVATFEIYEAILDIAHTDFRGTDLCNKAQLEFDWLTHREPKLAEWQRFAALFGTSFRKAHAYFEKRNFWDVRNGIWHCLSDRIPTDTLEFFLAIRILRLDQKLVVRGL